MEILETSILGILKTRLPDKEIALNPKKNATIVIFIGQRSISLSAHSDILSTVCLMKMSNFTKFNKQTSQVDTPN